MKHIFKKIFLVLFLPCLLISCSCSRGEYVDLPAFSQEYALIYNDGSGVTCYTDYQKEYKVSDVLKAYYLNTDKGVVSQRWNYIKNEHLYGIVKLVRGNESAYSGFCFDFVTREVSELFYYPETEILEKINETIGCEVTRIEYLERCCAYDVDDFDYLFPARINETTKIFALEIIIDTDTNEIIYFDKYIQNQKDRSEEIEKKTGIKIENIKDERKRAIVNPQYTKNDKTYVYSDDFLIKNSDFYELILARMKYERMTLLEKIIQINDGKLFIRAIFYRPGIMSSVYSPTFVFTIEPTTGYATYICSISSSTYTSTPMPTILGAIHL